MIDWVEPACRAWGKCVRWIEYGRRYKRQLIHEGYPSQDTIAKARDGLLNVRASGPAAQHFGEVLVGDALAVSVAMRGEPDGWPAIPPMPEQYQVMMWAHYVVIDANVPKRADIVGYYMRVELSVRRYWGLVHESQVWLSARLPSKTVHTPERSAARGL